MTIKLDELRKLPVVDKLRIVEQLWDDIGAAEGPIPLPSWVTEEARRRAAELEANPEIALTREEVWRQVDQSDG